MKLEEIMKTNWKKVREKFFYPPLPDPVLVQDEGLTAAIEMKSHLIGVSENFVEKFKQKGLDYDTIFTGLLAHELGHYLVCPFDIVRGTMIDLVAKKVDPDNGRMIRGAYEDIVVNLDLVVRKGVDEIAELLKAQGTGNPVSNVILAYYQKAMGYDMEFDEDAELDDFLKEKVDQMMTIDFFDTKKEKGNVKRFARIIKSILQKYNMKMEEPNFGNFGFESYDQNEANKAVRELAKKLSKEEFDKAMQDGDLQEALGLKQPGPGQGDGDGDGGNPVPDHMYYVKLAENYPVGLKKRPIEKGGAMFPYSHKPFEIDDNPQDVDVFASMGKPFLPGIGKTWVRKEGEHYAQEEEAPNVIIMKDISGSMQSCTPHAEAACVAAANAYMDNGAKVAVYLFNTYLDETELGKGYQDNPDSVHKALTKVNSGGTTVNEEMLGRLEEMLKKSEKTVEIVLVTDLEIGGRERLFEFLHEHRDNRVTVIYTGTNGGIAELEEKYADANFAIYHITKPEDIPAVVIGEVEKSIK